MSKTELRKTVFKCDFETCDKQFVLDETNIIGEFYKSGWIYLHNLAWKTDPRVERERGGRHFCCQDHLISFITNELQKRDVTEDDDNLCPPFTGVEPESEGFPQ